MFGRVCFFDDQRFDFEEFMSIRMFFMGFGFRELRRDWVQSFSAAMRSCGFLMMFCQNFVFHYVFFHMENIFVRMTLVVRIENANLS